MLTQFVVKRAVQLATEKLLANHHQRLNFYSRTLTSHSFIPAKPTSSTPLSKATTIYEKWGSYEIEQGVRANYLCQQEGGKLLGDPGCSLMIDTIWKVFQSGLSKSAQKNCLGWREADAYKWWSYEEVNERVFKVASALSRCQNLNRQECVGIYSIGRPEWVVAALAAWGRSLVVVPLYDTLGETSRQFIIKETEMKLAFVDTQDAARRLISSVDVDETTATSLKTIIAFEKPSFDLQKLAAKKNVTVISMDDFSIMPIGEESRQDTFGILPRGDDLSLIMYTSGTTGEPKGVVHTHKSVVTSLIGTMNVLKPNYGDHLRFSEKDIALLYLPMAHSFGIMLTLWFLIDGASVGFYSGNILKLLEDASILRPTYMPFVPRLMTRIHAKITGEVSKSPIKSRLFWFAYARKLALIKRGIITRDTIWDKLIFGKIQKKLFGGRVWCTTFGTAPLQPEILEFWRVVFGTFTMEGYGLTECFACATAAVGPKGGNVGHPLDCNYVKVVDVPELGYFAKDGRGELCLKGHNLMVGYYKRPEKTAEVIDADGWLHTGDIGEFLPDGSLRIIERKGNMFKLAQGEFIAPEKIENIYMMCQEILQIFVDGKSTEAALVAIVVPEPSIAQGYASKHGLDPSTICSNDAYKKLILEKLIAVGKVNGLNSLEQVKSIHLNSEPFSIDNGLLTPTLKNKRRQLRAHFSDVIDDLYKEPMKATA